MWWEAQARQSSKGAIGFGSVWFQNLSLVTGKMKIIEFLGECKIYIGFLVSATDLPLSLFLLAPPPSYMTPYENLIWR